jgi:hypothetical protein
MVGRGQLATRAMVDLGVSPLSSSSFSTVLVRRRRIWEPLSGLEFVAFDTQD